MSPFKVKICGLTNRLDVEKAIDSGADAIGLNFYAKSSRSVTVDQAAKIFDGIASIHRVGVFVNHTIDSFKPLFHDANSTLFNCMVTKRSNWQTR